MKLKLITSIVSGILLPWLYFAVNTVGPVRYIGTEVEQTTGKSGITGFIEFYGITDAVLIYMQTAIIVAILVFFILTAYSRLKARHATKA